MDQKIYFNKKVEIVRLKTITTAKTKTGKKRKKVIVNTQRFLNSSLFSNLWVNFYIIHRVCVCMYLTQI